MSRNSVNTASERRFDESLLEPPRKYPSATFIDLKMSDDRDSVVEISSTGSLDSDLAIIESHQRMHAMGSASPPRPPHREASNSSDRASDSVERRSAHNAWNACSRSTMGNFSGSDDLSERDKYNDGLGVMRADESVCVGDMLVDDLESDGTSSTATSRELFGNHPWKDAAELAEERQRTGPATSSEQIAMELARLGLTSRLGARPATTTGPQPMTRTVSLADMYRHRIQTLVPHTMSSSEPFADDTLELTEQNDLRFSESRQNSGARQSPRDSVLRHASTHRRSPVTEEGSTGISAEDRPSSDNGAAAAATVADGERPETLPSEFRADPAFASGSQTGPQPLSMSDLPMCGTVDGEYRLQADAPEFDTPIAFIPSLRLLRHQRQALAWMIDREREGARHGFAGGILADEPGLGKTLTAIALVLANKNGSHADADPRTIPATLVICPLSLLRQWSREIRNNTIESLGPRVIIYHGSNRNRLTPQLACADFVLTTYAVVCAECSQTTSDGDIPAAAWGALFHHRWQRIILDEAQYIRNVHARVTRAICLLESRFRWCLTGTPIQNSIHDLLALLVFLRHPECYGIEDYLRLLKQVSGSAGRSPTCWNTQRISRLLQPVLLRRCRNDRIRGRALLELHGRFEVTEYVELSPAERRLYESMELLGREALRRLSQSAADSGVCMHVLVMITRLRQICDHYTLLEPYMCRLRAEQASFRQAPCYERYQRTSDRHSGVCCIACGALLSPLPRGRSETDDTAAAREALCGYCVAFTGSPSSTLAEDRGDPLDRPFSERDPIRYEPHSLADCSKVVDETISAWTSLLLRDTGVHDGQSSKLRALLALLDRSRLESPDEKWVVFSQWPSFLDICEDALLERGQAVCRVDGLMRYEERELNLELFHRSEYPILLMSIGAGGVGLNLTQANRVVLIDPWWNPAVEEQAIDRVYRLGQRRPVRVTRLVVRDSVEERVMQLQQQKRALYEHVLDSDRRPSVETRLTVRDLHWLMRST